MSSYSYFIQIWIQDLLSTCYLLAAVLVSRDNKMNKTQFSERVCLLVEKGRKERRKGGREGRMKEKEGGRMWGDKGREEC